jgi:carboxyl-terminal processing protease
LSKRPLVLAALVIVAFASGIFVGARSDGLDGLLTDDRGELSEEALDVIEDNYFRSVDAGDLEDASVEGMVRELRRRYGDRFSHYFDPRAFERFQQATQGSFSGVGLSVTEIPRGLRVATVFKGSPAREAGIRVGDVITAVNGEEIAGEDAELSTAKIKGRPGTDVTLTVLRPSEGNSREIELERARLQIPAVEGALKRSDGRPVAYVRLLAFSRGAHAELRQEIERLDRSGAEGLLVDLRGNGGGLLTEAVLASSVLVEDGTIVSTEGRHQGGRNFEAVGDALEERPTVVLINGDTASASEIMTASLREAGLAQVVGERSFGKGTFQEVIPLDGGGALDLTVGEYETRSGRSLSGEGIQPDFPVEDRPGTRPDEGLRRALQVLGNQL